MNANHNLCHKQGVEVGNACIGWAHTHAHTHAQADQSQTLPYRSAMGCNNIYYHKCKL